MKPCPPKTQLQQFLANRLTGLDEKSILAHVEKCLACQKILEQLTKSDGTATFLAQSGSLSASRALDQSPASAESSSKDEKLRRLRGFLSSAAANPETSATEGMAGSDASSLMTSRREISKPGPEPNDPVLLAEGACPLPGFRLVKLLGRGGFGEVWNATGPGGFSVALKFIQLGGDSGRIELHSLELMKSISHGHLLPMFGAWQVGSLLIIAMELAHATLLDELNAARNRGKPGIPFAELIEFMRDAAKGIDYLNERRHPTPSGELVAIQHKDIKPQNLLVVGGTVKVADFGLARVLQHTVTMATGNMTPAYAPPEFFEDKVTRWSDQYSLAITYCQLRGGRLPFEGSHLQIMAGHASRPPELSMIPGPERDLVARALAKKPAERWPNCRAFVEALATVVDVPPISSDETLPHVRKSIPRIVGTNLFRRSRMLFVGSAVILLIALIGLWLWSLKPGGPGRATIAADMPKSVVPEDLQLDLGGGVKMEFVLIKAGSFLMGSPGSDRNAMQHEKPMHRVTLTKDFYLGKFPVTREQFGRFVEEQNYKTEAENSGQGGWGFNAKENCLEGPNRKYTWRDPGFEQNGQHPVVNVCWFDADVFCTWLGGKNRRYCELPSEAQWEYAYRAGTQTRFFTGDNPASLEGFANIADATLKRKGIKADHWEYYALDDGYAFTSPVGVFKSNPWGLYDMCGNVWQWCRDYHEANYYAQGDVTDPEGPGNGDFRIQRGGSWRDGIRLCRAGHRRYFAPVYCSYSRGFRVLVRVE
jgi:formylglycine-generating enzyme required for sulfatase activity/serine/threonine protein kinase